MERPFNPLAWFDRSLELIAEHPNVAFWSLVGLSTAAAALVPPHLGSAAVFCCSIPMQDWLATELYAAAGLATACSLTFVAALVTPVGVSRRLAVALIVQRVARFLFAVTACAMAAWAAITVAVSTYRFLDGAAAVLAEHRGYVPPTVRLYLFGGAAIVTLLFLAILAPVVRDVARLLAGIVHVLRYAWWARQRRGRATDPEAPLATHDEPAPILLVSDLHATSPGALTLEGSLRDDAMRSFLADRIARLNPRLIIAAGDVTDAGDAAAWDTLKSVFPADRTLIVAPGNHDVNFRHVNQPRSTLTTFVGSIDLDPGSDRSGSYSEPSVRARVNALSQLDGLEVRDADARRFPVVYNDGQLGVTVLVLDSNRRESSSPITNALGYVGAEQLSTARRLLAERTDAQKHHALLVVMHHHVLPAPQSGVPDLFLVCTDAGAVLDFALSEGAAALIHGHKHMPYVRVLRDARGELRIVSLGSALYRAEGPCREVVVGPSVAAMRVVGRRDVDVRFHEQTIEPRAVSDQAGEARPDASSRVSSP